jgi:hypothetical protein
MRGLMTLGSVLVALAALLLVSGCGEKQRTEGKTMADKVAGQIAKTPLTKTLSVVWQRLVDEKGQTCDRCGLTEQEVDKAVAALKNSLGELGIGLVLEKRGIDAETCAKDMSQSNRIWIGGQTLEELLGATSGMSLCGSCCSMIGDAVDCRTLVVDGQTYEAIPAQLIVRAGLIAGSRLLTADAGAAPAPASSAPCCGTSGTASSCGTGASCGTSCSIAPTTWQSSPTPPKSDDAGK